MNIQDQIKITEQNLAAMRAHEKGLPVDSRPIADRGNEAEWYRVHPEALTWSFHQDDYRPATLTFPEPPPGQYWQDPHGLTPEQVRVHEGWRLTLRSETTLPEDAEFWADCRGVWRNEQSAHKPWYNVNDTFRTKAPLPTPSKFEVGKKYKTPKGHAEVVGVDADCITAAHYGELPPYWKQGEKWAHHPVTGELSGLKKQYPNYRLLPELYEPKHVPLEAKDVPPGSVFRGIRDKERNPDGYIAPTAVCPNAVHFAHEALDQKGVHNYFRTYQELMDRGTEILRPGSTEWQPCYKEV